MCFPSGLCAFQLIPCLLVVLSLVCLFVFLSVTSSIKGELESRAERVHADPEEVRRFFLDYHKSKLASEGHVEDIDAEDGVEPEGGMLQEPSNLEVDWCARCILTWFVAAV